MGNQQNNAEQRQNYETYDVKEAYSMYFNMKKEIYPQIITYLTTTETPECRGLKKETLEIFRVGVGQEKFRND